MPKLNFHIEPSGHDNKSWVKEFMIQRWGAEFIVAHGEIYYPDKLPGFAAIQEDQKVGVVTYTIVGRDCEIVSLDSKRPSLGIGSALIDAVKAIALQGRCKRIWLTTTNDNLNALRFYQKRGFVLVKIHRNAVEIARKHKHIPLTSADGIPILDEIELEIILDDKNNSS